ncbi:helix-turn-helix domain-containing protein [Streptomyces bambusae]|uniref:helix-turn-helix domain-containing protein n=1 Tax=Streptomyces bambusae TaxID=1550616 RepID=UPI001CFF4D75|nr:helix-turn-helix transcriptional regulator [Streptomyces bambusae]MCB5163406.1 helix-turn-helix domain-containing protein [Streptomyces bambusae]
MAGSNPDRGVSVSTALGRRLGGELLRMREALDLRQAHAAEALTASVAKVAKMERGLVPMRDPDVRALCHCYGETDPVVVDRLLELARLDRERRRAKGWWHEYFGKSSMAEYVAMEDVATHVRTWQAAYIPGLLQAPEYVRALVVSGDWWQDRPEEIENVVEGRLKRQRRLWGDDPLYLHAVIWEAALRQQVGGPEVMRAQLAHLLEASHLPNVHIQVLPFRVGAHAGLSGAFNVLSFEEPDALDVGFAERLMSTEWAESKEGSAQYRRAFDDVCRLSLSPHDSRALIETLKGN